MNHRLGEPVLARLKVSDACHEATVPISYFGLFFINSLLDGLFSARACLGFFLLLLLTHFSDWASLYPVSAFLK